LDVFILKDVSIKAKIYRRIILPIQPVSVARHIRNAYREQLCLVTTRPLQKVMLRGTIFLKENYSNEATHCTLFAKHAVSSFMNKTTFGCYQERQTDPQVLKGAFGVVFTTLLT